MIRFPCPLLRAPIELTDERAGHVAERHPDLLPRHLAELAATLTDPDDVIEVLAGQTRLFVRWADTIRGGRFVVAVVVSDPTRHWIVTAYVTRRRPLTGAL